MDLSKYPRATQSDYMVSGVGDPIPLYSGDIDLVSNYEKIRGRGNLQWSWFPFPQVRYDVVFHEPGAEVFAWGEDVEAQVADNRGFFSPSRESTEEVHPIVRQQTGIMKNFTIGAKEGIEEVKFLLPNMPAVYGLPLAEEKATWKGRAELQGGGWDVIIDARRDLSAMEKGAKESGSYVITHVGCLKRSDGYPLEEKEITEALALIRCCLSFGVGRYIAPILVTGHRQGEVVWRDFRVPPLERWRATIPVIDTINSSSLQELFSGFAKLWEDEFESHVLTQAVQYYISANNPKPVEIAISSAQSGLEMLAYEKIVEEEKLVKPKDFEGVKWKAGRKIDTLLKLSKISSEVPTSLPALKELSLHPNSPGTTGPWVIAWMRNGVVHPSRKRLRHSYEAWVQAWQLACHYLALSVLARIGHQGFYRSPMDQDPQVGKMDKVPWLAPDENRRKKRWLKRPKRE